VRFTDLLHFARRYPDGALVDVSEHRVLIARIPDLAAPSRVIEESAEFAAGDSSGVLSWVQHTFDRRHHVPALCGFTPARRVLRREQLSPKRCAEPGFLAEFLETQYAIKDAFQWHITALNPLDGASLPRDYLPARPSLVFAVDPATVRAAQRQLLSFGLLPRTLEISALPLLGGIQHLQTIRADARAVVVIELSRLFTDVLILGKDGVHTPARLPAGLASLAEAAQREFTLPDVSRGESRLRTADQPLLLRTRKLVQPLARVLKPAIDAFEIENGQHVGEIYCAGLSADLAWLNTALADAIGRDALPVDCTAWLTSRGLRAPGSPLGAHWLPALSLLADYSPELHGQNS
jgi:hypothetical protein